MNQWVQLKIQRLLDSGWGLREVNNMWKTAPRTCGFTRGRDWVWDGMDVSAEVSMAPCLTVLIMIGWRNEESQWKGWTSERRGFSLWWAASDEEVFYEEEPGASREEEGEDARLGNPLHGLHTTLHCILHGILQRILHYTAYYTAVCTTLHSILHIPAWLVVGLLCLHYIQQSAYLSLVYAWYAV